MPYEPIDRRQRTLWLVLFWVGVAVMFVDRPVGACILLSAGVWWFFDPSVRTRRIERDGGAPAPGPDTPPAEQGRAWVSFAMHPEAGQAPLEVHFDATPLQRADDPISALEWSFGKGIRVSSSGSHLQMSRQYADGGKHRVRLMVRYASGETRQTRRTLNVEPAATASPPREGRGPRVTFEMKPESGRAPLTVRFDASPLERPDDPIVSLDWDFGDGTRRSISDRLQTSRRYTAGGKHRVSLTAKYASGESRLARRTLNIDRAEAGSEPPVEPPPVEPPPVEPPPVEPPPVEPPPVEPPPVEPPPVAEPAPPRPPPPTGAHPGPARRSALLRGVVRHCEGAALPGVVVSVVGSPGCASAPTGPDGTWELAVDFGGYVVLRFAAEGFLPSQRRLRVARSIVPVVEVALVPLDASITSVRLTPGSPLQVARGTKVTDSDGERTPTVLFPSGTRATVVRADGTVEALEHLSVRATEYTAGPHGPAAMPAELPTGVAYTYCVELSVDEAAGAEVRFNRPVIHYVENFLGFPVGGRVPVGWYDAARAAWMPSANGRVVRVLEVDGGLATLDVDGSGRATGPAALDALGVDEPERRHLAGAYAPGQTLWRVPVPHFSPWDCNWPFGPPKGARPPPNEPPRLPGENDPCPVPGSIVEVRNQALGERVPIPGTPYALVHWSRRGLAYAPARTVEVPLVGEAAPEGLRRVEAEVIVAGRRIAESFAPAAWVTWRFTWDGLDAGGRPCNRPELALVRAGYTYEGVYREPASAEASFALPSDVELTGTRTRQEVTLWREWPVVLGQDDRGDVFPRWQLDVLHAFDRGTGRLSLGNGRTTAARGRFGFERVDGIDSASDAVLAPDGSLFVVEPRADAVRRVRPDGRIEDLATGLDTPNRIALGPDGASYVAERGRIVRIAPDGARTPIAGGGSLRNWRTAGALATESYLFAPSRFAVAADGSLYLVEHADGVCIRRVRPDGRLQTIFAPEVAVLDAGDTIRGLVGDADGIVHAVVRHTVDEPGADRVVGWSLQRFEPGRTPRVLLRREARPDDGWADPLEVVGALPGAVLVATRTGKRVEVMRISQDGRPIRHVDLDLEEVRGTVDGTLFVRPSGTGEWRRVAPDGAVTAAPTYDYDPSSVDFAVAMGPDGTVCVSDSYGPMLRLRPGGSQAQFVGQWVHPDWENDDAEGPIVVPLPELAGSWLQRVGADGSMYILDEIRAIVHRVDPEGRASIVAGVHPSARRLGDGGPATEAVLPDTLGALTVGPDGAVYFAHDRTVRRVGTDGSLSTLAWRWPYERQMAAYYPDGLGFEQNVIALKVTPSGDLTIATGEGVLRLGSAGAEPVVAFRANRRTPASLPVVRVGPDDVRIGDDGDLLVLSFGDVVVRLDGSGRKTWETALAAADLDGSFHGLVEGEGGEVYLLGSGLWRPEAGTSVATGLAVPSPDGDEEYVFDPDGRHLRTLDARTGDTIRSFEYKEGRLARIVDGGAVTRIEWEGDRAAFVAPSGARTEAVLTGGELAGLTLPGGAELRFAYERGLLARFTDARGATHRFTYDSEGRLVDDEDGEGGRTSLRRTELPSGFEVTTTSALGVTTTERVERLPSGELRVQKHCGGGLTDTRTRDGLRITRLPDGAVITIETPTTGSGPVEVKATLEAAGRRVTRAIAWEERTDGDEPCLVQRSAIGGGEETAEFRSSRIVTTTPSGRRSEVAVDRESGTVALRLGDGPALSVAVRDGRPAEATLGGRRVEIRADALGRPAALVGPGGTTELAYDTLGRLIEHRTGGEPTRFEYDRAGDLVALSPPGCPAHRFEYTRLGQLARYLPPGETDEGATAYGYDADGRLATIRLPGGGTVEFAHDGDGRLTSIRTPSDLVEYSYTAGTLTRIAGPSGIELRYRHEGSLPVEEAWEGTVRGTVHWLYDERLRRAGTRVNDEPPVRLAYDADGLLVRAGELTLERGPDGAIRATRIGGVADAWSHDALAQPERYRVTHGGREVLELRWVRDATGRVVEEHETVAGRARIRRYTYDAAGRLSGDGAAIWRYDANGNQVEEAGAGVRRTARYDDRDRLLEWGAVRFEHDAAGAVARRIDGERVTRYGWDARSQLTRVELPDGRAVEYLFDGQHRRIGRKVDGRLVQGWLYDGGPAPVAELDASSAVVARFVYGTRSYVPDYLCRDDRTFRLVTDGRGSVRLVVDVATGEIAQELDYDVFGRVLRDTRPGFQPFGFAGGVADPLTGLVHFGSRPYDPDTARWLAPDPTLFAGGTNLYAYCDGDPVNRIDPAGTVPLAVMLPVLAGLVGAGIGAFGEAMKENPNCRDYLSAMILGFALAAGGTGLGLALEAAGASALVAGALSSFASSYGLMVATMNADYRAPHPFQDLVVGTVLGMVTGGVAGKLFPTRGLSPQQLTRMLGKWRLPKSVPQSDRVGHFKPDTWNRLKGTGYGGAAGGAAGAAYNARNRRRQQGRKKGPMTWDDYHDMIEGWRNPDCC